MGEAGTGAQTLAHNPLTSDEKKGLHDAACDSKESECRAKDPSKCPVHGSGASKKSVDKENRKEYNKLLKGTVTSNGTKINAVSLHAASRMKERNMTPQVVRDIITNPDATYPGNTEGSECYQKGRYRVVIGKETGNIVSAIDLLLGGAT